MRAVLLHGFTQTGTSWDAVVRALGPAWHAAAPDLRGHGHAADVRPVTFETVREDLDVVVDGGAEVLCGYSMGGRLALDWALTRRRGPIGRLVLVGASPGLADPDERAARRADDERLAARVLEVGVQTFAAEWGAQELFAGQSEAVATAAHAERLRQTERGLAAVLRGVGTGAMRSLWDRLGELTLPVTLVVGERDEKFRGVAEEMAGLLRDARVVVVAGAGHAVHLEAPVEVARAIVGEGAGTAAG
jgi:2-succinyl-6-hydroxy-2,4-cyclohexadiene-1-carboxylate synthase